MKIIKLIDKDDLIFIAGHKGMVGSAIRKRLMQKGYKNLLFADRKELDLRNDIDVKNGLKLINHQL